MYTSKAGKLTTYFAASFVIWFFILQLLIITGQRGGEGFFDNLYLAIPGVLSAISGVLVFFTGFYAIIRKRERSFVVYIATFLGFLVTLFIAAEVVFPH